MDSLNSLIDYDKQLLLFLHSKGCPAWDGFWLFITNPIHWVPLFLFLGFLGYRVLGAKKIVITTLVTILSGWLSLLIVNIIKNYIQRVRPLNDISINNEIRILIEQSDFSFVSGHTTVSFTITFISYWVLKKYYRFAFLIFLFPILFAYSRIYLAVHYPIDILFGLMLGYLIAITFYKIVYHFLLKN